MTNVIHESFKYGDNFKIGHYCVIEEGVVVGDNVTLRNWVWLRKGSKIGNDVYIDAYCKTGDDCVIGNNVSWKPLSQISDGTIIEDDVFIGPDVVLLRGLVDGRNVPPHIGKGAYLGGGVTVMPGVKIGKGAILGTGAVVTKDVPDGVTVAGVPAKPFNKK